MFKKILYPTDFSECAKDALRYVKKLKEAGTEEVIILNVVHELGLDSVLDGCKWAGLKPSECKEDVLGDLLKNETKKAEKILKEIERAGLKGAILIEVGNPAKKILEIAEKNKVSLIIMGAHGREKVNELLLGSVTEKVYRHAKMPVLVVR